MTTTTTLPTTSVIVHPELPNVTAQFEWVDPELAELYLLTLHGRQRPRSERKVDDYTRNKLDGLWQFNGATICLSEDEEVMDGQHRLMAIVRSGIGSYELVVRGLGASVIEVQDLGTPRTFYTWLRRYPRPKNPVVCRGVTGMIWQWQHENYGYRDASRVTYPSFLGRSGTTPELQRIWHSLGKHIENAGIHGSRLAYRVRKGKNAKLRTPLAFAWLTLRQIDLNAAEKFFHCLVNEVDRVADGNRPIRILAKELADSVDEPHTTGWILLHYIFHAWNLWYTSAPSTGTSLTFKRPSRPESHLLAMPVHLPIAEGKVGRPEPFDFFQLDDEGRPILPPLPPEPEKVSPDTIEAAETTEETSA